MNMCFLLNFGSPLNLMTAKNPKNQQKQILTEKTFVLQLKDFASVVDKNLTIDSKSLNMNQVDVQFPKSNF